MASELVELSNLMEKPNGYCPGCGHGIYVRLIQECIHELGAEDNCIAVIGVGCSDLLRGVIRHEYHGWNPHGRAASVATGVKRILPEVLVYTYQGDGDSSVIGMADTLNAAYRNENICSFIFNNTTLGMTGGQLAWSTLSGQITATSRQGRDCAYNGSPLHMPELVAREFPNIAYAARGCVDTPANILKLKDMIRQALQAQLNGEGYSMVEAVGMCPANWKKSPLAAKEWLQENLLNEYPLGEFKTREVHGK